jgi:hypothetical protein
LILLLIYNIINRIRLRVKNRQITCET